MTTDAAHREFIPGTTGWTVDDLDDPEIERLWFQGRYAIVEGVLTLKPAAYFDGGVALQRLLRLITSHTMAAGAEAGIPNYWLLDSARRTLECLTLDQSEYRVDQSGKDSDELHPGLFPGRSIPLDRLWAE